MPLGLCHSSHLWRTHTQKRDMWVCIVAIVWNNDGGYVFVCWSFVYNQHALDPSKSWYCLHSNHCLHSNQEHFYDIQSNTGFLEWRIKTVQRQSKTTSASHNRVMLKGGPTSSRTFGSIADQQMGDECMEAMSLLHHTTDRDLVFQKMRETFHYRQQMLHDPQQSADILQMFPRFLDTKGLVGNKCEFEKHLWKTLDFVIVMVVLPFFILDFARLLVDVWSRDCFQVPGKMENLF